MHCSAEVVAGVGQGDRAGAGIEIGVAADPPRARLRDVARPHRDRQATIDADAGRCIEAAGVHVQPGQRRGAAHRGVEHDRTIGMHRQPMRTIDRRAETHVAAGDQGRIRAQDQRAVVVLVATGGDVVGQADGRGPCMQARRSDLAQDQGIGIGDRHRATGQVHRSDEVVACLGQGDVAGARIDRTGAAHRERAGLDDGAPLAARRQVATHHALPQAERALAAGGQGIDGQCPQGQRVAGADRDVATGQVHGPVEVVAGVGQRDVARTRVDRTGTARPEFAGLGDAAGAAERNKRPADPHASQVERAAGGHVEVLDGVAMGQVQRVGIAQAHRRALALDAHGADEIVAGVGQLDVARRGNRGRPRHRQRAALADAPHPAHRDEVAGDRSAAQVQRVGDAHVEPAEVEHAKAQGVRVGQGRTGAGEVQRRLEIVVGVAQLDSAGTGIDIARSGDDECPLLGDVAGAGRNEVAADVPAAQRQRTAAGGGQAGHIERVQMQGIGIAHDGGAAFEADQAGEVVAGVVQRDRAGAGVDGADTAHRERAGLADRATAAARDQHAGDAAAAQAEGARAVRGQLADVECAQGQGAPVADLDAIAAQCDRAGEVVIGMGQEDVACAGIETGIASDMERVLLRDAARLDCNGQVADVDRRRCSEAQGVHVQTRQRRAAPHCGIERDHAAGIHRQPMRSIDRRKEVHSAAGVQGHVLAQHQGAVVGLAAAGGHVTDETDAGRRGEQARRVDRAQVQGSASGDGHRTAPKVHGAGEAVAGVGQEDVPRAGIDAAGAIHGDRALLGDAARGAGCGEITADIAAPQRQCATAGRVQAGNGELLQPQAVGIPHPCGAADEGDGTAEIVVHMVQRDGTGADAVAGVDVGHALDPQRPGLGDPAAGVARRERAADRSLPQGQGVPAVDVQAGDVQLAQAQGIGVADIHRAARQVDRATEIVVHVAQRDRAGTCVQRCRPLHGQGSGRRDRVLADAAGGAGRDQLSADTPAQDHPAAAARMQAADVHRRQLQYVAVVHAGVRGHEAQGPGKIIAGVVQGDGAGARIDRACPTDRQRAGLGDAAARAGRGQRPADLGRPQRQRAAGTHGEAVGHGGAQPQRVGIAHAHGRAVQVQRSGEIVAGVVQRDGPGGINPGGARDRQRTRLGDRSACAGGAESVADQTTPQRQRTGTGRGQVSELQYAEGQGVRIAHGGRVADETHGAGKVVVGMGQCDVADTGVDVRQSTNGQRAGLGNAACAAVRREQAADGALPQRQCAVREDDHVGADVQRAELQRVYVAQADRSAGDVHAPAEIMVLEQLDHATAGIEGTRAGHPQRCSRSIRDLGDVSTAADQRERTAHP